MHRVLQLAELPAEMLDDPLQACGGAAMSAVGGAGGEARGNRAAPRQTPKIGSFRRCAISIVVDSLKSVGEPGPGDRKISCGLTSSSCASEKPARRVTTVAPVWRM